MLLQPQTDGSGAAAQCKPSSNCCKPGKKRLPQAHEPEIPVFSSQRQEGIDGMYTLVQNDQEILRHRKKADQNRCDQ